VLRLVVRDRIELSTFRFSVGLSGPGQPSRLHPRTRRCHTGTRARPRLSTPAIFTRCRRPPEDRLPPATAGLPAIPLHLGQPRNDPP
jgi:hypothetical protein